MPLIRILRKGRGVNIIGVRRPRGCIGKGGRVEHLHVITHPRTEAIRTDNIRNSVATELIASVPGSAVWVGSHGTRRGGVIDGLLTGKIPVQHRCSWEPSYRGAALSHFRCFVIEEPEGPVSTVINLGKVDGTARREAIVVALVLRVCLLLLR